MIDISRLKNGLPDDNSSYSNLQTLACLIRNQYFGGFDGLNARQQENFGRYIASLDAGINDQLLLTREDCIAIKDLGYTTSVALQSKYHCSLPNIIVKDMLFDQEFRSLETRLSMKDTLVKVLES